MGRFNISPKPQNAKFPVSFPFPYVSLGIPSRGGNESKNLRRISWAHKDLRDIKRLQGDSAVCKLISHFYLQGQGDLVSRAIMG